MVKHKGGVVLWTLFFVTIIIFASGAVAVYTVFMKPESKATVPLFRERMLVDAVAEAEKLGLVVQVEPVASSLPDGRVLAQAPEVGTELRKGQVIVLQVSRGGELHAVPDVKGKSLADAQNEIKSSGFALGDVVKIHEPNVQAGSVIAQSPAAPANIASGRKIDLLVQDGAQQDSVVKVPDVNRMTEQEARDALEASGLKVSAVDRVYSPLLPEGLAIETRPSAGSSMRTGQGVTLKLATQRRPAGYMGADTTSTTTTNGTARRVTSQQTSTQPAQAQPQAPASPAATAQTPPSQPAAAPPARTQAAAPANPITQPASSGGSKTARVRYIVPPIARPMDLRIELTDPTGKRTILSRQVQSGQSINTTASYNQECVITIYLGGSLVWQEKQR